MTALPYTDDDLRAEAARQHAVLTEDPDFVGVGEQMQDSEIESLLPPAEADGAEGPHWDDVLDEDQFHEAQRAVHRLISHAADVSRWAVNLGADGLEPDDHTFQLGTQGTGDNDPEVPFVRLHFAFHPDATADERDHFAIKLAKIIAANL
jgi:hypothetical protein